MKGVYPVTGSGRATLCVEKSGWCCLQPAKIPSLCNAFLACLDSLSEINLLGALPHCNPTSQQY